MTNKSRTLFWVVIAIVVIAGFKTEKIEYTGIVVDSKIESDWNRKRKKREKDYYVDILIEDEEGTKTRRIKDKKIATNFNDYFLEEIRLERKTRTWYGFFEKNYSDVIDYSI